MRFWRAFFRKRPCSVDLTRPEGVYYMGKVRKNIRNFHDGTEDGERLFDAIVEEGRVTIEL